MSPARLAGILTILVAFSVAWPGPAAHGQFVRPERRPRKLPPAKPERPRSKAATERKRAAATAEPGLSTSLEAGLALQLALEREGFSPGIIDGAVGRKTRIALAVLQAYHGRTPTGTLDDASRAVLDLDGIVTTRDHRITDADAARVGPCPTDWIGRSRVKRLPYPTLLHAMSFEGHCSKGLIRTLNPGLDVDALKVGDTVRLPNVQPPRRSPDLVCIDIDFDNKLIGGRDGRGRVAALFHCSIAREKEHRPSGECRINSIALHPEYTFRPECWPEVKGIDRVLTIPSGPRNPVGLCWIDLSIDGYGIHGTPDPEMIGKTGSHGCFRLANWDVLQLARWVKPGMEVRFIEEDRRVASAD